MKTLNVGYGNFVTTQNLLSVTSAESSPSKRLRTTAIESDRYIDATEGRKTLSLVTMKDGYVIGSAVNRRTLMYRLENIKGEV